MGGRFGRNDGDQDTHEVPVARRRDLRTNGLIGVGNGTGTGPRSMDPRTGRLMKGRILTVDDETKVLQGPRRMCMRMRNERKNGLCVT